MRLFGLIGYPLTHSFSKKYFTEKFAKEGLTDCMYHNFPLPNVSELPALINSQKELKGINVTIPHKLTVMSYLTDISEEARAIGAVNVIKITNRPSPVYHQILTGYNTDAFGFENSLKPLLQSQHKKALILGTGGASKAIAYVLNKLGIDFLFVSRKRTGDKIIGYNQLTDSIMSDYLLIINTSPLGTYPAFDSLPLIPYQHISSNHLLYDLVYNPEETLFLQKGKERGAATQNGLLMLKLQADKAWEIWNNQ